MASSTPHPVAGRPRHRAWPAGRCARAVAMAAAGAASALTMAATAMPPGLPDAYKAAGPASAATAPAPRPARVTAYVLEAEIVKLEPATIEPGRPLMLTVQAQLGVEITPAELADALDVYVDSVIADAGPRPAGSAAAPMPTNTPLKQTVTLRVTAPPANELRNRDAAISVFSRFDRREVASTRAPLAATALMAESFARYQWPLVALLGLSAVAGVLLLRRRRVFDSRLEESRRRVEELEASVLTERRLNDLAQGAKAAPAPAAEQAGRPPELPPELFDALARQELVVVLGAGASAQAGLPTSRALWLRTLDLLAGALSPDRLERLQGLVAGGGSDSAAEVLVSTLGRPAVFGAVQKLLAGGKPSPLHRHLAALPLRALVDWTWDELMADALAARSPALLTPTRHDDIAEVLREGRPALLKPLGHLAEPDSLALTQREFRLALSKAPEFERSLTALFTSRTMLFVGLSLEGLDGVLGALPPSIDLGERRHFALMPAGNPAAELWQDGPGRRFGVRLLDYVPSADHREVPAAVEQLVRRVPAGDAVRAGGERPAPGSARLEYLQLESIGLFPSLRVEFEPGWTLLLGNNGGGKSTILRAAVLALAGNDPRAGAAAARLLRSGAGSGSIELGLGGSRVLSQLVRDGTKVVLQSPQTTLLQAGQLLVLGFPALRGVTSAAVRGPNTMPAANPSVDDVAPLLSGTVDTRMDSLHQWVVNTALRAEAPGGTREARMLDTFQRLVSDMVPGGGLRFARVDRESWQVILQTGDGEVPFDGVSQGMSAIMNWVGILLQRLYDVYPRAEAPEREAAVVLVDEIDAHLHPEWQRRLVTLTREHFPNVQIVASTHSPLLAGAVAASQLRLVARDPDSGRIRAERPAVDMAGQKVEDILVSSLFSLLSTRSPEAEATIREYLALFQQPALDAAGQRRLAELGQRVEALNFGATLEQRAQIEQMRQQVRDRLDRLAGADLGALARKLGGTTDGSPR